MNCGAAIVAEAKLASCGARERGECFHPRYFGGDDGAAPLYRERAGTEESGVAVTVRTLQCSVVDGGYLWSLNQTAGVTGVTFMNE